MLWWMNLNGLVWIRSNCCCSGLKKKIILIKKKQQLYTHDMFEKKVSNISGLNWISKMFHYKDTDVETQHNGDVMFENVYFSVSVRGWKQMTESFAREHFAHRIKIGWLGLNLSKEQPQIPHSQTLYGSHLRCLWAVVEGDISLSWHLLQKPFSTSTGLWRICKALSKEWDWGN